MKSVLRVLWKRVRRTLRKVWASRGGGYYGLVVAVTFVYLEVVDLAGDLAGMVDAWPISLGWIIAFVVGNLIDAFINGIAAAFWPIKWLGAFGVGPTLLALLGATYVTYRLTRPAILRLLAPDEDEPDEIEAKAAAARIRHT